MQNQPPISKNPSAETNTGAQVGSMRPNAEKQSVETPTEGVSASSSGGVSDSASGSVPGKSSDETTQTPAREYHTPFHDLPFGVFTTADSGTEPGAELTVVHQFDLLNDYYSKMSILTNGQLVPRDERHVFTKLVPAPVTVATAHYHFPLSSRVIYKNEVFVVRGYEFGATPGHVQLVIYRYFEYLGPDEEATPDRQVVNPEDVTVPRTRGEQLTANFYPYGTEVTSMGRIYYVAGYDSTYGNLIVLVGRVGMDEPGLGIRGVPCAQMSNMDVSLLSTEQVQLAVGTEVMFGDIPYKIDGYEEHDFAAPARKISVRLVGAKDPELTIRVSRIRLKQVIVQQAHEKTVREMVDKLGTLSAMGHIYALPTGKGKQILSNEQFRVVDSKNRFLGCFFSGTKQFLLGAHPAPGNEMVQTLHVALDLEKDPAFLPGSTPSVNDAPKDQKPALEKRCQDAAVAAFTARRDATFAIHGITMGENVPMPRTPNDAWPFNGLPRSWQPNVKKGVDPAHILVESDYKTAESRGLDWLEMRTDLEAVERLFSNGTCDSPSTVSCPDRGCRDRALAAFARLKLRLSANPPRVDNEQAKSVSLFRVKGEQCTLADCPPGMFLYNGGLGFKTEYQDENGPEAYCLGSGEYFWGGTHTAADRRALKVTPLKENDAQT